MGRGPLVNWVEKGVAANAAIATGKAFPDAAACCAHIRCTLTIEDRGTRKTQIVLSAGDCLLLPVGRFLVDVAYWRTRTGAEEKVNSCKYEGPARDIADMFRNMNWRLPVTHDICIIWLR